MTSLITHHQTLSLLPLRWKHGRWLGSRDSGYFLSFADAWRGMFKHDAGRTRTILVPDFYCPETLALYKNYGRLAFYQTNNDLTINIPSYLAALHKYRPEVIINYGFLSSPFQDARVKSRLKHLPEVMVIEDCAHRILLEKDLIFAHKNHVYIDSIRKQTSLLGSHLFGQSRIIQAKSFERLNWYKVKSLCLKLLQEGLNISTYLLQSRWLHEKSEDCFEWLDDLIGANQEPTQGGFLSRLLWNHLDLRKILVHKKDLIGIYYSRLTRIKSSNFLIPPVPDSNLSYFPCVVSPLIRDNLIDYLETRNIWIGPLWDLSEDSPAGLNQNLFDAVVVLPLTWETTVHDAERVCQEIELYFNSLNGVNHAP